MSKTYQKTRRRDESGSGQDAAMAVPEQVNVSLAEIAASAKEGLLALSVGVGLQVMGSIMDEDVAALCGPKGRHNRDRVGYRHSGESGSVTLGGRRVPVRRPRVRAADGSGELPVPSYEVFANTDALSAMAMERMLAGLSTRRYGGFAAFDFRREWPMSGWAEGNVACELSPEKATRSSRVRVCLGPELGVHRRRGRYCRIGIAVASHVASHRVSH